MTTQETPQALFTACKNYVCPRCNAQPGQPCRTPKGKIARPPHKERIHACVAQTGWTPYEIQPAPAPLPAPAPEPPVPAPAPSVDTPLQAMRRYAGLPTDIPEEIMHDFRNGFDEEHYLVAAIRTYLMTPSTKARLHQFNISIEDILNGRVEGEHRHDIARLAMEDWNRIAGEHLFG